MADVDINKFRASVVRDGSKPSSPGFIVSEGQDPVNPPGTNNYVPYSGATANVELGEYGVEAGFITLDTTPTNTPTDQGTIYWDVEKSTAALIMNGTIQHIGQDTFFYCKNSTGSSIPKGTSVRFAGTDGASGHILITPFLANGSVPSNYFIGVTAEVIGNGSFGQVMHFGELDGINTSGYTAGALLYASTTVAGGFQTTAPVAPNNIVLVAAAVNSKNNGAIVVRPTYGSNINTDEGVKIVSVADKNLLQYQSGTSLWENKSLAQVLGGTSAQFVKGDGSLDSTSYGTGTVTSVGLSSATSGVTIGSSPVTTSGTITLTIATASGSQNGLLSSADWTTFNSKQNALTNPVTGTGSSGQVAFFTGTTTISSESNLFWNQTDNLLGIGTNSPQRGIHISGTGAVAEFLLSNTNFISGTRNFNIWANTNNGFWELRTLADNFNSTGVIFANLAPLTGNILINKTSDSGEKLQIIGGASTALRLESNSNVPALSIGGTGDLVVDAPGVIGGRFFVNNSGNVGIGKNSPSEKLHVVTSIRVEGSTPAFNLYESTSYRGNLQWQTTAGSVGIRLFNIDNSNLMFGTTGTEKMRLTEPGNLLIGTTTDNGVRLQVSGGNVTITNSGNVFSTIKTTSNTGAASYLAQNDINTTTEIGAWGSTRSGFGAIQPNNGYIFSGDELAIGASLALKFGVGGSNTERMRITSGGNLLVGTTTDIGQRLQVSGGYIAQVDGGVRTFLGYDGTGSLIGTTTNHYFRFITNDTERMRITSGGNVGIGSNPGYKLNVFDAGVAISSGQANWSTNTRGLMIDNTNNGDESVGVWFRTGNNHLSGISGQRTNSASDWSTDLRFYTHPTSTTNLTLAFERLRITSEGNVLIGSTTDNGSRLQVNGAIRTAQPVGTTSNGWLLGRALVSGTSTPDRWIRVQIGLEYYDILAVYMGTL